MKRRSRGMKSKGFITSPIIWLFIVKVPKAAKSLSFIDDLPATQEDNVVWDCDNAALTYGGSNQVEEVEEENSLEFTSSFTWKEIHRSKRQRLSETPSYSTQNFQELLAEIGASAAQKQENTSNVSFELDSSMVASTKSQVSINLPPPSQLCGTVPQSQLVDNLDFEMSEEFLQQIEAQATAHFLTQQNPPQPQPPPPSSPPPVCSSQPAGADFSLLDDMIEVPVEFLAMCDELEKQALASQPAAYAAPSLMNASMSPIPLVPSCGVKSSFDTLPPPAVTPQKPYPSHNQHLPQEEIPESLFCLRLVVVDIQDHSRDQKKVLISQTDESSAPIIVELHHDWYNTSISIGDKVHVLDIHGDTTANHCSIVKATSPTWIVAITNECGVIIVAPDTFVSPTKIAESCTCTRRGVITDRLRSFGNLTSQAIMGNVRHMFIELLTEKVLTIIQDIGVESLLYESHITQRLFQQDPVYLPSLIQLCVQEHMDELFNLTITDTEIERELRSIVNPLIKWVLTGVKFGTQGLLQQFAIHADGSGGLQSLQPQANPLGSEQTESRFEEVVGIEETIHSPILGIKGQVDMIMGGKLCAKTMKFPITSDGSNGKELMDSVVVPIELKTGMWRPSTATAHRAQVILYILLMLLRERTSSINITNLINEVSTYGWLVYINQEELKVDFVVPTWLEIRSLLLSRNQLAKFIQDSLLTRSPITQISANSAHLLTAPSMENLPPHLSLPPILNASDCTYCYNTAECFLYHGSLTDSSQLPLTISNVTSLYSYVLKGIQAHHLQYFKQWDRLIDLESLASSSSSTGKGKLMAEQLVWQQEQHMMSDVLLGTKIERHCLKIVKHKVIGRDQLMLTLAPVEIISPVSSSSSSSSSSSGCSSKRHAMHCLALGDRVQVSMFRSLPPSSSPSLQSEPHKVKLQKKKKPFSKNIFSSRSHQQSSYPTITSSSSFHSTKSTSFATTLAPIHVNMCSGSVQLLQETQLDVLITNGTKTVLSLLKQLEANHIHALEDIGWYLRVDKDEMNIHIATMRSNLMELFVEPYNSKVYLNATKRLPKVSGENAVATAADELIGRTLYLNSALRQKIRELIVDLRPPQFASLLPSATNFRPPPTFRYPLVGNSSSTWTAATFHEELLKPLIDLDELFCELWILWMPKNLSIPMFLGSLKILRQCLLNYRKNLHAPLRPPVLNDQYFLQTKLVSVDIRGKIVFTDQYCIYPGCYPWSLYQEYFAFNPEQQACVHKVLATQDYSLIWGLPGSGKSTLLSYILRILIARNEKILLTSYTHNAVDHLMEKLLQQGVLPTNMMKLTSQSQRAIPPGLIRSSSTISTSSTSMTSGANAIVSCSPEMTQFPNLAAYREYIRDIRLFVSTISTVSRHNLMKTMKVDWCVVDEAGQLLQPMILGGILKAHKFVLVGDDYQLPPLVLSKDAIAQGMDVSLFKRLIDSHPGAMCSLTAQYRMNASIMSLCNAIVYEGRMTCGSLQVANARLNLPNLETKLSLPMGGYRAQCGYPPHMPPSRSIAANNNSIVGGLYSNNLSRYDWLYLSLLPSNAVVFLNTDNIPMNALQFRALPPHIALQPDATTMSTTNIIDAYIIHLLLWGLEQVQPSTLTVDDIAIITPFRSQVQLLQQLINDRHPSHSITTNQDYEISTVDRYQGKDKAVIILNTVKRQLPVEGDKPADNAKGIGYLLKDWRRINVALTRAKLKLIIVGSVKIMDQDPILQALLNFMTSMQWTLDLPPYACEMYQTR